MRLLVIQQWLHHKNLQGLKLMLEYIKTNIETNLFYKFGDQNDLNSTTWDVVYSPAITVDTNAYPNTFFIFGPHFSVFPSQKLNFINNKRRNCVYIQPSEWALKIWRDMGAEQIIPLKVMNFPVNVERFKPIMDIKDRNDVFIYYKRRSPDELNVLENYLRQIKLPYTIFNYVNKYDENDYINKLLRSKFGIVLDAHESQGFAIEEALSCDVPLLVWNATTMKQENGSNYPDLAATSIPYWNNKCGEVFYKWNEFKEKFNAILKGIKNNKYHPRQFILDELSTKPCAERFFTLINSIK